MQKLGNGLKNNLIQFALSLSENSFIVQMHNIVNAKSLCAIYLNKFVFYPKAFLQDSFEHKMDGNRNSEKRIFINWKQSK